MRREVSFSWEWELAFSLQTNFVKGFLVCRERKFSSQSIEVSCFERSAFLRDKKNECWVLVNVISAGTDIDQRSNDEKVNEEAEGKNEKENKTDRRISRSFLLLRLAARRGSKPLWRAFTFNLVSTQKEVEVSINGKRNSYYSLFAKWNEKALVSSSPLLSTRLSGSTSAFASIRFSSGSCWRINEATQTTSRQCAMMTE